jgi:two-component system OmpR family response regulator
LLVSRLRQRLGDDAREPRYIKTVRSEGYVFSSAVHAQD